MVLTVRPTKDDLHRTLSNEDSSGYTLACRVVNRSVGFKDGIHGAITHCPLCGNELGEWDRTERIP